jgi:hypothetical protein
MKLEQITINTHHKLNTLVSRRNAYHQAGHVVSIYLGNKQKKLPAVHFQLTVKPVGQDSGFSNRFARIKLTKQVVKLEGGRLIPNLPCCYEVATRRLSPFEREQCQTAFEADVINLLAGSLAEAKYVALRDGEVFNANLVYLGALRFYGGSMDLEIINEYIECLIPDCPTEQQVKLAELFLAAYSFINDSSNWFVITRLAETIFNSPQEVFSCEQLIAILDSTIPLKTVVTTNSSCLYQFELAAH